ncbi:histidine phosphatase family protein [Hungatella hathewayi]|nr:histidine phosphatase family protein [Hungatella hathewayi]
MIRGYLIRHSMTGSNALGRYAGKRTDEALSTEGISLCLGRIYPQTDVVYTSPMRRCIQTAGLLYCGKKPVIWEQFTECDFGIFEGKNYKELSGEPEYQEWIASNGTLPFPEGESREEFQVRCLEGFCLCIEHCIQYQYKSFAMVVHGGTIMSILDGFAIPHRDYFHWQVKNLEGYEIETDEKQWASGRREIYVRREGTDIWK